MQLGFLGSHILDSYLKNESGKIYCIVRPEPGLTSEVKLYEKLNYYFGKKYNDIINKKIFVIEGDITKEGFGLNQSDLLDLSNSIDIVINSAAKVSHYGNYQDFYNANVKSVNNIITFCKNFNKRFYQISTESVSGNSLGMNNSKPLSNGTIKFTENDFYINQSLENVYVRSKFEAEYKIIDAISKGLDGYILRMGNLMPRIKDFKFQENAKDNAYISRIIAFLKLGAIPESIKNIHLEFTPIDSAANAIIKIIQSPSSTNRIFHLLNHNYVYLDSILKILKKINLKIDILPENNFKDLISETLNNKKSKDILNLLINDFDNNLNLLYKNSIIINSDFTINYLNNLNFAWPEIKKEYLIAVIKLIRRLI